MSVRNLKDGTDKPWLCECYPNGREGRRVRKKFATKGEATAFELFTMKAVNDKPWLGEKADNRRLSELIQRWHDLHGRQLNSTYGRMRRMQIFCKVLEDPIANCITANDFANFRNLRMNGDFVDERNRSRMVSPSSLNTDLSYLKAMFNELRRLGEWKYPNPLADVKPWRTDELELSYLHTEDLPRLLHECEQAINPHLILIVEICLSTGCRWSEAANLKGSQVKNGRITFIKTKGKRNRTVPISDELFNKIPKKNGPLFSVPRHDFASAVKRAGLTFPKGQMTHILRHTFASHFMMNGGNIIVLRDILGHTNIELTMRYAHFAPEHLDDAITKNPLANLDRKWRQSGDV
ncbi:MULTISPECIES: phage integrase [Shewanella]|uniref:phage integrase n=1 Tax=Shewanella TaxID=22 RepID=UPI00217E5D28|nr:tyrosine-type recombinase/integrase [Shewanella baltica]MCS6101379.1 tyrosine-type recombinase/integrase [Shewanella baltica]MCS6184467.1 tyrosine-type recombinase/integrase [Shewanella baltica]